MRDRKDYLLH